MALAPEIAFRDILVNSTGVNGTVSTRIYMNYASQNATMPFIILERMSADHYHHMIGITGLQLPSIVVSCYADRYITVKDLGERVRNVLDGYTGTRTVGGQTVTIGMSHLHSDDDDYLVPISGKGKGVHVLNQVYLVAANEATSS